MSVNPLQENPTRTRPSRSSDRERSGADEVNLYGRFAQVYDVFGSEEFCLAMTTHLLEAADRYSVSDGVRCVDLACGTGVITCELARFGFAVTGVDLSEHMLEQARRRAEAAGLAIDFLCMDMRELVLDEPVPWILCTHDSLDHLYDESDLARAFAQVFGALVEGGLFMFDMNCWEGIRHLDGKTVFVETEDRSGAYHLVAAQHSLRTTIVGFLRREGNLYERFDEVLLQRCYTNEEIATYLEAAGFEICECTPVQHLQGDIFKQLWICRVPGGPTEIPEVI